MRVNDKHLAAFASGTAPIDKEGYLSKRGEVNKAFQKRWFVLKGNLLFYYEKKSDKEPIGAVILEGCTVELSESNDAFTFALVFEGSGSRTYVLSADTQEEMEDWMKAIACAGYDYMKLMVAELQRQMDDLTTDKTPVVNTERKSQDVKREAAIHNGGEGLLVDLSVPGADAPPPVPPRQPPGRRNPFNLGEVDQFGSQPFEVALQGAQANRPRNFMEMHKVFGHYINKKVNEYKRTGALMS